MTALGIHSLGLYLTGTLVIVLLPGPNSLYVASQAAQRGRRPAFAAALGIMTGDAVLVALVALGAGALLRSQPSLVSGLGLVGGVYLSWLGIGLLRSALYRPKGADASAADSATQSHAEATGRRPYWVALGLSLTNPKAILFLAAYFTQFVHPTSAQPIAAYAVLGLMLQGMSLTCLTGLILLTSRMSRPRGPTSPLRTQILLGLAGLAFLAFGIATATGAVGLT